VTGTLKRTSADYRMNPCTPADTGGQVKRVRRGFTLIEVMIVVVIISILVAISLQPLWNMRDKARIAAVKSALKQQMVVAEAFFSENGTYLGYFPVSPSPFIGMNLDFVETAGVRIRAWDNRIGSGMCWLAMGNGINAAFAQGAVEGIKCKDNDTVWE